MSSVHSQTSEVDVPPVVAAKLKQSDAHSGRNASDTSIASMKSTITFEKQKVVPRTRTMSVQSVLSSFSLRNMLHNNKEHQCDEEDCTNVSHKHCNTASSNGNVAASFVHPTQQIQSPAMASTMIKKRNTASGKTKQTFLSDLPLNEPRSRIGQKLPFTDDKRKSARDLHKTSSSSNTSSNSNRSDSNSHSSEGKRSSCDSSQLNGVSEVVNGRTLVTNSSEAESSGDSSPIDSSSHDSESEEDDISKQNKLTTDALRKLSMLQQNKGACAKSIQTTPLTSSENLLEAKEPLTQLKFCGKYVILDTASSTNRKNSAVPEATADKGDDNPQSPDIISHASRATLQAPAHNFNENKCSRSTTPMNSKKVFQQINEPKKPMYTPAVLRDIAETNITMDKLQSRSQTPSDTTQTTLQADLSETLNRASSSYAASITSTTSSIMSSYKNRIQSWLGTGSSQPRTIEPTREHWVPDSKRNSCKYCHKVFTFWERKHHCRHCGDIFCQHHVRHWLYLNPDAKFIIGSGGVGVLSRICDSCLEEYENLVKAGPTREQMESQQQQQEQGQDQVQETFSPTSSSSLSQCSDLNENEGAVQATISLLPKLPNPVTGRNIDETLNGTQNSVNNRQRLENLVGSVPVDWSWSSF